MPPAATTLRQLNDEAAAELLERRWFAAQTAASMARADCEVLLEAIESTKAAWNCARARLAELESLRDSLGDQLATIDAESDARPGNDRAGGMRAGELRVRGRSQTSSNDRRQGRLAGVDSASRARPP